MKYEDIRKCWKKLCRRVIENIFDEAETEQRKEVAKIKFYAKKGHKIKKIWTDDYKRQWIISELNAMQNTEIGKLIFDVAEIPGDDITELYKAYEEIGKK